MTTFTSDDREEAYKKILEEAPASPPHIVDSGASVMGMSANELADWIEDENVVDIMFTPQEHYRGLVATMLRQQQAELTEAGHMIGVLREYISDLENGLDSSIKLNKAQAQRQVKELTDEEIRHIQAICHLKDVGYDNFIMRFARAILRKAQEK